MQKQLLGSAGYEAQYQQRPAPAGGRIFQRAWFRYYDELPALDECAQSWDMAFKDTPAVTTWSVWWPGEKAPTPS